ncbi:MAG: undecaprenyl-phosphate galactose phosphotransferase WbaP [Anaerolineales bacterium]|nr:undecaprenyl-phosphate galactose phosphotransferase WbaP [Anaerolineales bacterium]
MSEITIGMSLGKTERKIRFRANHRVRMFAITLLSDLLALILSTTVVHLLVYRTFHFDTIRMGEFGDMLFAIICMALLMTTRLYPGIGLNPALEMKTVTHQTAVSFLIVFSFLMIRNPIWTQEKLTLILVGSFSIITLLGMRWLMRIVTVQLGVWGEPVVVVAGGERMEKMMGYFHERRRLGFLPVLGVSVGRHGPSSGPMLEMEELLKVSDGYFSEKGIQTVLVSTQIASDLSGSSVNRELLRKFKRMIFISDMDWLEGVSIAYHDFEGMLGMEAQQNFLNPLSEVLKRMMDVVIAVAAGIASLPVLLLTAVLIKLESSGSVLYRQERVGKDGKRIMIYKFRSMREDGDQVLEEYLAGNPSAQAEWNETQKLKEDPRITRVGKWVRKFSLDELPQLYNILKGDMSVVGPRPILVEQRRLYGEGLEVYMSVRPGLTGFWQVSGRNRTSFCQRAIYDVYYVRNWSAWLDMYILLRTIWVVLTREGAY